MSGTPLLKPENAFDTESATPVPKTQLKGPGELSDWQYESRKDNRPPNVENQTPHFWHLNDVFKDLCNRLENGIGFETGSHVCHRITARDDKLATAGGSSCADGIPGKLIVFGQCKTGTNWQTVASQLPPRECIKRWFRKEILVDPNRAFFVSEALGRSKWSEAAIYASILIDRCRIVSLSENIASDFCRQWTESAFELFSISNAIRRKLRNHFTGWGAGRSQKVVRPAIEKTAE